MAGFEKVMMASGTSATVTFQLKAEQLTVVDGEGMRWPASRRVAVVVPAPTLDPRARQLLISSM